MKKEHRQTITSAHTNRANDPLAIKRHIRYAIYISVDNRLSDIYARTYGGKWAVSVGLLLSLFLLHYPPHSNLTA